MTRLEDELRRALAHEDPPAGFAERVLARAAEQEGRGWGLRALFAVPGLRWAAAVAALVVVASGVGIHVEQRRRAEGEEAKRQVMLALRITGQKWQVAAKEISGKSNARGDESGREMENHE